MEKMSQTLVPKPGSPNKSDEELCKSIAISRNTITRTVTFVNERDIATLSRKQVRDKTLKLQKAYKVLDELLDEQFVRESTNACFDEDAFETKRAKYEELYYECLDKLKESVSDNEDGSCSGRSNSSVVSGSRKSLVREIERQSIHTNEEAVRTRPSITTKALEEHERMNSTSMAAIRSPNDDYPQEKFEYQHESVNCKSDHSPGNDLIKRFLEQQAQIFELMTSRSAPEPQVKLPPLKIPMFNGDLIQWLGFKDIFVSVIEKARIPPHQKLAYLKGSLSGEALALVNNLGSNDSNYPIAWKLLKDRYDQPKNLINAQIKKYFRIGNVTGGTKALRELLDKVSEIIQTVESMGPYANSRDPLWIYILVSKFDSETENAWVEHASDLSEPKITDVLSFLQRRVTALESRVTDSRRIENNNFSRNQRVRTYNVKTALKEKRGCLLCKESHLLIYCPTFRGKTAEDRLCVASKNNLCFNCLKAGHAAKACTWSKCQKCGLPHHTFLHREKVGTQERSKEGSSKDNLADEDTIMVNSAATAKCILQSQLPTALVRVDCGKGKRFILRALLDTGSQTSFITSQSAKMLGLVTQDTRVAVTMFGGQRSAMATKYVSFEVTNFREPNSKYVIEALVMQKLTAPIDGAPERSAVREVLDSFELADPHYSKTRGVDILIGANHVFDLLRPEKKRIQDRTRVLKLQNSVLGWLIYGTNRKIESSSCNAIITPDLREIDRTMRNFWEIEDIGQARCNENAQQCEIFEKTHQRREDGKFIVTMPFKNYPPVLGESRNMAITRFEQLERRFNRDSVFKKKYVDFIRNYELSNYMRKLTHEEVENTLNNYYLPHHGVYKQNDKNSKLRVVFDASAKSSNGRSLNDELHIGQKLQRDVVGITLRLRLFKYVMTCDIRQMYCQILMNERDVHYQRIVWRENSADPVNHYCLLTLTFGENFAPCIAISTILQLAKEWAHKYPETARVLRDDIYVDDIVTGSNDLTELIRMRDELITILSSGGFELRKWASNHDSVLSGVPDDHRLLSNNIMLNDDEQVKMLGMHWRPNIDTFHFEARHGNAGPNTKRSFLSSIARVYDPLGLIAPITVGLKIIMQSLWTHKPRIEWDDNLPKVYEEQWITIRDQLQQFSRVNIPRIAGCSGLVEVAGFADASKAAYAAVLYIRDTDESGCIRVRLLMSKTKVAPLAEISIPRLELCAATLLAKLLKFFVEASRMNNIKYRCYSDSSTVLSWISSGGNKQGTFVTNRIKQIVQITDPKAWHYVATKENPADLGSRGLTPMALEACGLWWNGPDFLSKETLNPQSTSFRTDRNEDQDELLTWIENHSNYMRLIRSFTYVLRFTSNIKLVSKKRKYGPLQANEIMTAQHFLIKRIQQYHFAGELKQCRQNKKIVGNSPLRNLALILDSNGLLRLRNRVEEKGICGENENQLILPKGHLSRLIVSHMHRKHYHAGTDLMMAVIQKHYWILGLRGQVKQVLNLCKSCTRYRGLTYEPIMGNLPNHRTTEARPFYHTGVDYAGPISVRPRKGRGNITEQGFIALFVCMSIKAIHIEWVTDASTTSFLMALKRFIGRRGNCRFIYSDNGRNFLGASSVLKKMKELLATKDFEKDVIDELASQNIQWVFNPPYAPHFGGLWEANIKSMKRHLHRTFNGRPLTVEEICTALVQIEQVMNSRPLTCVRDDGNCDSLLTPNHFLVGASTKPIDLSVNYDSKLLRDSFHKQEEVLRAFWSKWRTEYLSSLYNRSKWRKNKNCAQIGDTVLIKRKMELPGYWPFGLIVGAYPGSDGVTRVVDVKSRGAVHREAVRNLVPLISNVVSSPPENGYD